MPATVATIIKVLSPVQIEYAARHPRLMMPKDQAQDHHLAMILINREPCHTRSGRGSGRLAATSSSCLALLVI